MADEVLKFRVDEIRDFVKDIMRNNHDIRDLLTEILAELRQQNGKPRYQWKQ